MSIWTARAIDQKIGEFDLSELFMELMLESGNQQPDGNTNHQQN